MSSSIASRHFDTVYAPTATNATTAANRIIAKYHGPSNNSTMLSHLRMADEAASANRCGSAHYALWRPESLGSQSTVCEEQEKSNKSFSLPYREEKAWLSGNVVKNSASCVSRIAEHEESRLHGILFNNLFGHSGYEQAMNASRSAVRSSSICYIRGKLASL